MDKKERAAEVVRLLEEKYPDAVCSLEYYEPYQLLIATRLSAQCTDARVNMVTPGLFSRFPSLEALASCKTEEIEEEIRSCGLYHTKAKDISEMCKALLERFSGKVPDNMDDLLTLPGVGRKTANLILGDVYHKPAVVADTHCIRISGRLGLTDSKDPAKVEKQLREVVDPEKSSDLCHRFVLFGRETCSARSPKCGECILSGICPEKIDQRV